MPGKERTSPAKVPLLVILLGLSVAYFTYSTTSQGEAVQREEQFRERAQRYASNVEESLTLQTDLLRFLATLYGRDRGVTSDDLENFVSRPLTADPRYAALRTVAWVVRVPGRDLPDFERRTRLEGNLSSFSVHDRDDTPVALEGTHDVIDQVFPDLPHQHLQGLDLASDVELQASLERAALENVPLMSPVVPLLAPERDAGENGILVVIPVSAAGAGAGSSAGPGSGNQVYGFVVGMISLRKLLERADEIVGVNGDLPLVHLTMHEHDHPRTEGIGPPALAGAVSNDASFKMLQRVWEIRAFPAQPQPLTVDDLLERNSTLLTASVCIMMVLFAWVAWTLIRQKALVQQRVSLQTNELRQKNVVLEGKERELNEANRRLLEMSNTDSLTGILNRRAFEVQLDKERERSQRTGVSFGLLIFDVDQFKDYNDRYGHAAGDEVLRRVAGIINAEARRIDTVARYGGEEFVVLATGADGAGLLALGERIRGRIQDAGIEHGAAPKGALTVSCGGSLSSTALGHDPKTAFDIADRCLYEAKSTGRNRVVMVL